MTSIFNEFYLDNLERVNSSPSATKKNGADELNDSGEKFAKVLGDLEKKKPHAKDSEPLTRPEKPQDNSPGHADTVLTNLHGEANYSRASIAVPPQAAVVGDAPHDAPSVKTPSVDVKQAPLAPAPAAPSPVLPEARQAAPEMPQVISAKRVYAAAAQKSGLSQFDTEEIKDIIVTAGRYHGVDPLLSLAVAEAESAYKHDAISSDGHESKGVFQLLDSTGKHMKDLTGVKEHYDPFDPGMNAFLGVGYLRRLMNIFSSSTKLSQKMATTPAKSSGELEKLAVAAFNAGEGNVVRAQERAKALGKNPAEFAAIEPHLPASTRQYVERVTRIKRLLTNRRGIVEEA